MKNRRKKPLGFLLVLLIVVVSTTLLSFILHTLTAKPQPDLTLNHAISSGKQKEISAPLNSATFKDPGGLYLFSYPSELQPFTLSNGATLFLFPEDYDQCKMVQEVGNTNQDTCLKAVFVLTGFELNPTESYQEFTQKLGSDANFASFTGAGGEKWETTLVLGQVYHFDAFTKVGNTPIKVSFQYGNNDAANEQTIQQFFHQILSTFEFTSQ